jgi:2-succinyl-5-enolpyruvyl-6-hydroxy-3-cyclohexene-1-carboxylate synthase
MNSLNCFTHFIKSADKLLIIVGELPLNATVFITELLAHCHCPMIIEPLSQLRQSPQLQDKMCDDEFLNLSEFTHVLRLGAVPTTSIWRQLAAKPHIQVLSISHMPFSGLPSGRVLQIEYEKLKCEVKHALPNQNWRDQRRQHFALHPNSEPSMIYHLSKIIPNGATVYLGNSSPIRFWAKYATYENKQFNVFGSRGANGIDGQLSTFLGLATPQSENWCVIGDLTALYDLSAPWIIPQLSDINLKIVIIHNGGGQIFSTIFPNHPELINAHSVDFDSWSNMWKLPVTTITKSNLLYKKRWETQHVVIIKPK